MIAAGFFGESTEVGPAMVGGVESLRFPVAVLGGLERGEGVAVQQLHAVVEPAELADRRAELRVARVAAFECADLPFEAGDLGADYGVMGLVDRGKRHPLAGGASQSKKGRCQSDAGGARWSPLRGACSWPPSAAAGQKTRAPSVGAAHG